MSDALTYLQRARPEAMGHYFAFLKDAGKHLDPKTRALISVITKAHAQTERGLRQYLKRALRDGCTAAEILDALLMAFPPRAGEDRVGGRHRPRDEPARLQRRALAGEGAWHDVMAAADLQPGEARRVECDGRGLFIYLDKDGDIRVHDSRCPHQGTDVPQLALQGHTLTCPKHQWAFDVRSGACIRNGDRPLRRWESRVVEGRLQAFW
jgi:nitrite reductase/ring-hydroxylating ferredoxin subunit